MICSACHGIPHEGKPHLCPGSTNCDCQHRLVIVTPTSEQKEEQKEND